MELNSDINIKSTDFPRTWQRDFRSSDAVMTKKWPELLSFYSSLNPPILLSSLCLHSPLLPHPVWSSQTDPHCLFCLSPERLRGSEWANKKGSSCVSPYWKAQSQARKIGGKGRPTERVGRTSCRAKEALPIPFNHRPMLCPSQRGAVSITADERSPNSAGLRVNWW